MNLLGCQSAGRLPDVSEGLPSPQMFPTCSSLGAAAILAFVDFSKLLVDLGMEE